MRGSIGKVRRGGEGSSQLLACVPAVVALLVAFGAIMVACADKLAEAQTLEEAGDWEGALEIYEKALSEDPDQLGALSGAAVALMVLQRFDEALELQERVVASDPRDVQTRVELGFNYLNHQGRPHDAVRVLGEAAELDPTAKNLTFLAQALEEAGDAGQAEQTLKRALETDPGYSYAYGQLVELFQSQGRDADAEKLREQAAEAGVTIDGQQ